MKPHAVRLTAFGPFAETVAVDLDALAGSGLFLLHGATGAGKTTLLDGIGFALFGRVPGVRNSAKRLRSDHAAASVRTEVQLEATLGGRRVRITRSPQQERAKARGSGTTTEQARVLLEEQRGGSWVAVSTRVGEADAEIADLVGMSAEQFFQVVLLPQGDFAQFLRASSVDRAAVLQKLFATERFADVEQWLAGRRRVCAERVAAAREVVGRVVAAVSEVAGTSAGAGTDVAGTDVAGTDVVGPGLDAGAPALLSWAATLLDAAVADQVASEARAADATVARDACRAAADDAVRLDGLQVRRRAALARQEQLAAELPVRVEQQTELDAAARAAEVAGVLAGVDGRRADRDAALAAEVVARAELPRVGVEEDLDVAGLRAAAAAARERSGLFEAMRAVDEARRAAVDEAALAEAEQADALAAVAAAELELAGLPVRREKAESRLTSARAAAVALPALRAERELRAALRPDVVALAGAVGRVAQLQEEHLSARETALALEVKANDLRVASINSMIAALAFRLEDGVPCDVCGSPVHPDPSRLRDEGVSSEDEERARREADSAQERVATLQQQLAAEQARVEGLRARVGSWTLAALDEQLATHDLELDVLLSRAAQVPAAEQDLAGLDQLRASLASTQVAAATRAEAASRRAAAALDRAAAAAAELTGVLGEAPDVDTALAQAAAVVTAAESAATTAEVLAAAQAELERAVLASESACVAAGFPSALEAVAAQRTTSWREQTAAALREAADVAAALAAELSDPALGVPLSPPAPVDTTAQALAAADHDLARVLAELGERRQRRTALERLVPALAAELAALAPLEGQAREVRALADLCAGQGANGLRMTLTSFVLAARLEEVAEVASVRLLRMTQGRYALVHTDGAARGGSRSGLGLLVRDSWSGQDRDTSTLSGGETFLASLALALGLADVVSAEAGGARIGALFVDEGFGTLDEDTLDEVMDVLDGLREGGRVVGLVSHVSELRQRIPAQVEVRKTRAGSDVVLHGC